MKNCFNPLDFLAEITQHIPDPGMQMLRYYGWCSNKMRGQRAKIAESANRETPPIEIDKEDTPYRKLCRMRFFQEILCIPQRLVLYYLDRLKAISYLFKKKE